MTDAILKVKYVKDGGAVTLTDAMTGNGIQASVFGKNVGRTEAEAMTCIRATVSERGITLVDEKPEYIRADVAAAQLAERDARIAELEGHCIGYKHVAETEADRSLELEKRIAELEAAQRWVSVGERFPEVGQWVLVRIDAETLVFEFMGRGWRNEDEYIFAVSDVTHWMPLPPPPRYRRDAVTLDAKGIHNAQTNKV